MRGQRGDGDAQSRQAVGDGHSIRQLLLRFARVLSCACFHPDWRIPSQHGVQDFLRAGNATFLPGDGLEIDYIAGQPTYIELLAQDGYECGLSGKWHIGHAALQRAGFSYWNVHAAGGGKYYEAPMIVNGERYQPDEYVTDVITDNALEFLNGQIGSGAPFSLNVHYTAPHAPWGREEHPDHIFDKFHDNCAFDSLPIEAIHPDQLAKEPVAATLGDTPENRRIALSGYFAAVTEMDRNIGRILDWLEANGLRETTLIMFMADNGMNMGHHGIWGKGNGTYPPNMYDTAVKIPALASMPRQRAARPRLRPFAQPVRCDADPTWLHGRGQPARRLAAGPRLLARAARRIAWRRHAGVRLRRVRSHAHDSHAQLEVCAPLPRGTERAVRFRRRPDGNCQHR